MEKNKLLLKLLILLLFPFGIIVSYYSSINSTIIERVYSNKLDKFIRELLSLISGIFPFSLGELLIAVSIPVAIFLIIKSLSNIIKSDRKALESINYILNFFDTAAVIYIIFLIVWGLNYYRYPFAKIAKFDIKATSPTELGDLCEDLINSANKLRTGITENPTGIMHIPGGRTNVFSRVSNGYYTSSVIFPELGGDYGRPKGVLMSKIMSYLGISGIYFPFTGEPNVNVEIPDSLLPSTACHEVAHQRGFAREDEANYISYYVCNKNPDTDFKYSGTLLAIIHSMNALYSYDPGRYKKLCLLYSKGVVRDLTDINKFWSKYEGPIERISSQINNVYLKANNQKDGIYSYGRMVDLLLAERRLRLKNSKVY